MKDEEKMIYENPLITRYAGREMSFVFSDDNKFRKWRQLWIALAKAQQSLGLNITSAQIAEMEKFAGDINYAVAADREKETRHDVMSHIYAFGCQAKSAMPIIHLGATSCFVTDNAEILMICEALEIIKAKLVSVLNKLKNFALRYKDMPTLGFTHLQPAQLTTVGKRATLWMQDLAMDIETLEHLNAITKLRGVKGTTGTQASFLNLFDGDHEKVKQLEKLVGEQLGFAAAYGVTGQTYPRKYDYLVMSALSGIAQSAAKFSSDLRLLQHMKEIEEPFEKEQVGSSAMAYKRNPMRSERIAGLARFVISLPQNEANTSATQWLERTLDDSANKRITIAQGFLALDGILNLYINIADHMAVYEKVIAKHIAAELPFMATENILMECVKQGGSRQDLHERIRMHSMESGKAVKLEGKENDLIARIKQDAVFKAVHGKLNALLDPKNFIGRAPQQTAEFIKAEIDPILQKYKFYLDIKAEIKV